MGGVLETLVTGIPAGVGEPWFDSLESVLSHGLFSIPAIKGVEFGQGFSCVDMLGSEMNDSFKLDNGEIVTETNNNGGINGGISNGMPVIFRCAFRPTPTISRPQNTVDFVALQNETLEAKGRHDPCIVPRALPAIEAAICLALLDIYSEVKPL